MGTEDSVEKQEDIKVDIPKIGTITSPTIGGAHGIQMRVFLEKSKAAWVEVTEATINYFVDATAADMANRQLAPQPRGGEAHAQVTVPGARWVGHMRAYRVSYIDENNNKRYKLLCATRGGHVTNDIQQFKDRKPSSC